MKLMISVDLVLDQSVKFELIRMNSALEFVGLDQRLYTHHDGFTIETGTSFFYTKSHLVLPVDGPLDTLDEPIKRSYFNFISERDRYLSLKRLMKSLYGFSQSRIFQYDNEAKIEFIGKSWILT